MVAINIFISMSRESILKEVKKNQPSLIPLPDVHLPIAVAAGNWIAALKERLELLHVDVHEFANEGAVLHFLKQQNRKNTDRVVTTIPAFQSVATIITSASEDAHTLENVELAIIPAHLGVAENGAMWVTDALIKYRVLPFITQQLAVVVKRNTIVYNMHQAYEKIAGTAYEFGVFIAGPSKTADIEQSLVLGAHGPKGMMVFIVDE